jgi:predicted ATPase
LHAIDSDVLDRINDYLKALLPGLERVHPEFVQTGEAHELADLQKVVLLFRQTLSDDLVHFFWSSQMSDGTLRALGILTALLQGTTREGSRPSLVGIEEPEAQVHPAALGVLRDAMIEASSTTQVLVTTQSSDLLDNKEVETDSILAVSAEQGATRIGPIDEAGRSMLHQRLYTAGELLRIGQLFPATERQPPPVPSGGAAPAAAANLS